MSIIHHSIYEGITENMRHNIPLAALREQTIITEGCCIVHAKDSLSKKKKPQVEMIILTNVMARFDQLRHHLPNYFLDHPTLCLPSENDKPECFLYLKSLLTIVRTFEISCHFFFPIGVFTSFSMFELFFWILLYGSTSVVERQSWQSV